MRKEAYTLQLTECDTIDSKIVIKVKNIKSQLETSKSINDAGKEIESLLLVYINDDFERFNENVIKDVKEYISVKLLYSDENQKG